MPLMRLYDHTLHFMCSVSNLYEKMELTDCLMVTRGGLIHTHKIILAAHSPYLKKLLMNQGGMTSFAFKEVEHNIMKLILDMMYYGEAEVPETDVALFTETANLLQITSFRRASLNISETISTRNTSEGNNERNLPVLENGVLCNQGRSNSGFDNIDLQSIYSPETERNNLKKFLGKVTNDHPNDIFQNSSYIAKDEEFTGAEDLQDELNPVTFVAVPSVSVKNEEVDDEQSTSCISDLQLKNPLEECPHDCDTSNKVNFKREQEFLSESQIKMENKEEIADNEPKRGYSGSDIVPFINEMEQSFNEWSANVEDNMLTDNEPMERILGISVLNGDSIVDGTEDLKVKFESVCEISEFNLKEEKSLDAYLDIGNTEDIEPLSLKQSSGAVNCGEEELSLIGCQQDMNQGLDSACCSKFNMNESQVILNGIKPLVAKGKDSKNSAFQKIVCSLDTKEEKEFNNNFEERETLPSVECVTILSPEIDYEGKCNPSLENGLSCNTRHPIFVERKSLTQVTQFNINENSFPCYICDEYFREKKQFREHIRTHSAEKSFSCKVCQKGFTYMRGLQKHMSSHTLERPFSCEFCNASFSSKKSIKRHNLIHTDDKPFSCDFCKASFRIKCYLKDHIRTHTGEKPFSCDVCQASFSLKKSLKRHLRTHTGEKPFSCDVCQASFSDNSNFLRHKRFHTGDKRFSCDVCYASFSTNRKKKLHLRTHSGEKPFSCEVCEASFSLKIKLVRHIRTHTGEKPFSCDSCKASFSFKSSLMRHIRTHTGEKPYSCNYCFASFSQNGYLTNHMRTHTGEKPFSCDSCEASFSVKSSLLRHNLTHTGEKPYSCDVCKAFFTQKSSLIKHVRTH